MASKSMLVYIIYAIIVKTDTSLLPPPSDRPQPAFFLPITKLKFYQYARPPWPGSPPMHPLIPPLPPTTTISHRLPSY